MLENSILVDSTKGKELSKLLKDYQDVASQVKDLTTTKDRLAKEIKKLVDNKAGLYETMTHTLLLSEVAGRTTVDTTMLNDKYPLIFEEVKKVGNPTLQIKGVTTKGDRV